MCSIFCFAGFPTEDSRAALPKAVHGPPTPRKAAGATDVPPHLQEDTEGPGGGTGGRLCVHTEGNHPPLGLSPTGNEGTGRVLIYMYIYSAARSMCLKKLYPL